MQVTIDGSDWNNGIHLRALAQVRPHLISYGLCGTKIRLIQAIPIASGISTTIRYLHADSE